MKRFVILTLLLLAAALGALAWLARSPDATSGGELDVYCAAGLKVPVAQIAADFERETGTAVHLNYGGTATLLSQIRVGQKGDLFISADARGLEDARKYEVIREAIPLVSQRVVVVVRRGNPLCIRSFADLMRAHVRLAMANPEAAAIGRAVKRGLGERYAQLAARAVVFKPTVTEIAADVELGAADAATVWDSIVPQFRGTEAVEMPEFAGIVEDAGVAVIAASPKAQSALRFARYLAAPDKAGASSPGMVSGPWPAISVPLCQSCCSTAAG